MTTLREIYNFFKPLPETNVYSSSGRRWLCSSNLRANPPNFQPMVYEDKLPTMAAKAYQMDVQTEYGVTLPLDQITVELHEQEGDYVDVHWQYAPGSIRWTLKNNSLVCEWVADV